MTLHQFKTMNGPNQLVTLVDNGVFLAEYSTPNLSYRLYQIDGFYIEGIFSMNGNETAILRLYPFNETANLDRYLQQISLDGLLQ